MLTVSLSRVAGLHGLFPATATGTDGDMCPASSVIECPQWTLEEFLGRQESGHQPPWDDMVSSQTRLLTD